MRRYYTGIIALTIAFIILFLTSCSLFIPSERFDGGKLLDSDEMSRIKSEVFATDTETEEQATESKSVCETEERSTEREVCSDENLSKAESETIGNLTKTVFWTESGTVWHLFKNCGYLKESKNILSGSVKEALEEGKEKVCTNCSKRQEP